MQHMTTRFCNAHIATYRSYAIKLHRVYWALGELASGCILHILITIIATECHAKPVQSVRYI